MAATDLGSRLPVPAATTSSMVMAELVLPYRGLPASLPGALCHSLSRNKHLDVTDMVVPPLQMGI